MDWKAFATIFGAIFVAELGDKTQLATLLFSADKPTSKWIVFAASASALTVAALLGVLAGGWIGEHVPARHLKLVAGIAFVVIGLWTVRSAYV